ncbi:MAG: hypothetical protein Tsb0033_19190 [Winogradskyella sp.]
MRIIKIIILLSLFFSCKEKNKGQIEILEKTKIDSISSINEIRQFLKTADSSLINFSYVTPQSFAKGKRFMNKYLSEQKQKLESLFSDSTHLKEDFDKNGYTDLIITGEYYSNSFEVMVLMNYGKEKYSVIPLTLSHYNEFSIYPKLVYRNNLPVIELYSIPKAFESTENGLSIKRLVYKYGTFVDYTETVEEYQISRIEFSANACYGTCPVFELDINENTQSLFRAKYHNFSKKREIDPNKEEGAFETIIKRDDFNEICEIINFLQVKNLNEYYRTGGMHQPSCTLKVHFSDGTQKTIEDYGKKGTNGLHFLYEKLSDLRFNQEWNKM